MRIDLTSMFLDSLCNVSCGGQSTTSADLLTDVCVHVCIGSDVNTICPEPKPLMFIWHNKSNILSNMTHVCLPCP